MRLKLCWLVWALFAADWLAKMVSQALSGARQRHRVKACPTEKLTVSDMRVILMGDSRDPLERHADAMISMWRFAGLAFSAIILFLFQMV